MQRKKYSVIDDKNRRVAVIPRVSPTEHTVAVITWESEVVTDTDALMRVIREILAALRDTYEPVGSAIAASVEDAYVFNIGDFMCLLPDTRVHKELIARHIHNSNFTVYVDDSHHSHQFDAALA